VDGGGRSTIAIWLVAAGLALFAATRLFGGDDAAPPAVRIDDTGPAAASPSRRRDTARDLYVHVAGAVRRPGLIRVPPDTRVAAALEQAGGPTRRADLTLVNLAARVQDGQQVVVPVRGASPAATGSPELPGAQLHLSTATPEQLDQVDGIGPTLAERIVEYRDAHGGVRSIDELAEVDGIGEARLTTLRDALQP
jgi:competence protein ComEA